MNIWDYLVNKDFNGLNLFEFEEVREVFNWNGCFVDEFRVTEFVAKAQKLKDKYEQEIKRIRDYEQNEYNKIVDGGGIPTDDPTFMIGRVEGETRDGLIEIIKEFFDEKTFEKHKDELPINKIDDEMTKEDVGELSKVLVPIRKWFYQFLNTIGYYQRQKHYFISMSDMYKVSNLYSQEVSKINNMPYKYLNIFAPWGRLDRIQRGLIDADKISLQSLVISYLKHNTKVLVHIAEIMYKGFRLSFGDDVWQSISDEIAEYINECEKKNILKPVE